MKKKSNEYRTIKKHKRKSVFLRNRSVLIYATCCLSGYIFFLLGLFIPRFENQWIINLPYQKIDMISSSVKRVEHEIFIDGVSDWAYEPVLEAIQLGIVPSDLQKNYKENITKQDYSKMVISFLSVWGKVTNADYTEASSNNPFTDTKVAETIIADKLGLVERLSNNKFGSSDNVLREDAAVTFLLLVESMGYKSVKRHKDINEQSLATNFVLNNEIMRGGSIEFRPKEPITKEQTITALLYLYKFINSELSEIN